MWSEFTLPRQKKKLNIMKMKYFIYLIVLLEIFPYFGNSVNIKSNEVLELKSIISILHVKIYISEKLL